MASLQRCVEMLKSDDMKPFWEEIDRVYRSNMNDLRNKQDATFCRALDALDSVINIPEMMSRRAAQDKKTGISG